MLSNIHKEPRGKVNSVSFNKCIPIVSLIPVFLLIVLQFHLWAYS